ncbi:MAG: YceI family protein [bacterium]|nr:YceI family protein [bacterium]
MPASTVKWTGRRVGGEQRGTLAINEGWINLQGGQVTQGVLVFDMTTIKTTDQDAQGLTDELKSYNFFDVTTYPTAVFTITRVIGSRITGVLTMKGISNTITFP